MGIILTIIGLVAAGCLVAYAIEVTFNWLFNKIKEKLAKNSVKKIAVGDLQKIVETCENKISIDELPSEMRDRGYIIASLDENNKVDENDIEIVHDKLDVPDKEVIALVNRTGEGMAIFENNRITEKT